MAERTRDTWMTANVCAACGKPADQMSEGCHLSGEPFQYEGAVVTADSRPIRNGHAWPCLGYYADTDPRVQRDGFICECDWGLPDG